MLVGVAYRAGTGGPGRSDEGRPGHPARARRSVRAPGAADGGRTGSGSGRRPARHVARRRRRAWAPPSAWEHAVDYLRVGRRRRPARRRRPRRSSRSIAAAAPTRPSSTAVLGAARRRPSGRVLRLVADRARRRRRRRSSASTRWRCRHPTARAATSSTATPSSSSATAATTAFPGGGYLIVRSGWAASGWGDDGDGYMPFTFLRAYATELCTIRATGGGPDRGPGGDGPPDGRDRRPTGPPRLPAVPPRTALDVEIDRQARCADPRASLTHLFFSEDLIELARARAICSLCAVREPCLRRALERREPWGVWGGELVIDGAVVADKRGRGRPPKTPGRGSSSTRSPACRWCPSSPDRSPSSAPSAVTYGDGS